MDRETLISIINRNGIRFLPVRRCSLCDEYIGYKFVKMCDGSIMPVFSSGCGCCGVNNGQLFERTWDEVDGSVDTTDIVTSIESKNVVEFYVENPFIKIKDE